jgi:hypothetical protein
MSASTFGRFVMFDSEGDFTLEDEGRVPPEPSAGFEHEVLAIVQIVNPTAKRAGKSFL